MWISKIKSNTLKGNQVLNIHWKHWCWSWNFNTLATWCKELTHWKRPWCWERLKAGGEGDDRGWHGWMASSAWWTWVWASSWSWWWTGMPGMLQSMGLQRVGHDWPAELIDFGLKISNLLGAKLFKMIVDTLLTKMLAF